MHKRSHRHVLVAQLVLVVVVSAGALSGCGVEEPATSTVVVTTGGPGTTATSAPQPTTTTSTSPPRTTTSTSVAPVTLPPVSATSVLPVTVESGTLAERVPGLIGELGWVSHTFDHEGNAEFAVYTWLLDSPEPEPDPWVIPAVGPGYAAWDATGQFLVTVANRDLYDLPDVWIEHADGNALVTEHLRFGFQWHPTRSEFAYIEWNPMTDVNHLMRGNVTLTASSGPAIATETVAVVPDTNGQLLAWGDWGYLVQANRATNPRVVPGYIEYDLESSLYVLDSAGEPVRALRVRVISVLPDQLIVVEPRTTSGTLSTLPGSDPEFGYDIDPDDPPFDDLYVVDISLDPADVGAGVAAAVAASTETRDTFLFPLVDRVAIINLEDAPEDVKLTVASPDGSQTVALSIADVWMAAGMVAEGRYLVFQKADGMLVFLDWANGLAVQTPAIAPLPDDPEQPYERIILIGG